MDKLWQWVALGRKGSLHSFFTAEKTPTMHLGTASLLKCGGPISIEGLSIPLVFGVTENESVHYAKPITQSTAYQALSDQKWLLNMVIEGATESTQGAASMIETLTHIEKYVGFLSKAMNNLSLHFLYFTPMQKKGHFLLGFRPMPLHSFGDLVKALVLFRVAAEKGARAQGLNCKRLEILAPFSEPTSIDEYLPNKIQQLFLS